MPSQRQSTFCTKHRSMGIHYSLYLVQVTEQKPPSRRRHEPVGNGLHRTVTGSSLRLADLQALTEKAQEQECPKTPSSLGGRTPRSNSALSLASGSRASSIVQVLLPTSCPLTYLSVYRH